MSRLRTGGATAALALGLAATASGAHAADAMDTFASIAGGYNLYLSGDLGSSAQPNSWSDTEGKVAVGGDAYLRGYEIGLKDPGGVALTVGQNLRYESGTVHGSVVTGGSATFPTPYGGTTVQGTVAAGGGLGVAPTSYSGTAPYSGLPLDFAQTTADLLDASNFLNSAAAKAQGTLGVANNAFGTLHLTSAATGLVFFDLAASDLVGISGLDFAVNSAATVILNLTGQTGGTLTNYGFLGNVQKDRTLFNFVDATSLDIANLGVMGSILAAKADFTGTYGQINGAVIAKSYSGTTQINYAPFDGDLPKAPPPPPVGGVPEPSTWAMMMLGLASLGAMVRQRRQLSVAA